VAARVRALVGTATSGPAAAENDLAEGGLPEAEPFTTAPPAGRAGAWVPGMRPPVRHGPDPAEGWRARLRWDPGRRGVAALGLALVVVVAATGWWLAAGHPNAVPITATGAGSSAAAASAPSFPSQVTSVGASALPSAATTPGSPVVSPAVSTTAGAVVVDVAGKVHRPGVYTLPSGARVYDALRAAGGVRGHAGTLTLNLAAPLQDGEQIVVGVPGVLGPTAAVPDPMSGATTGSGAPAAPVDLNTATLEQLEALPGVGPVLGQNILDWRAGHQQFTSVDQLRDVSGIGDVRLAQLRPLVTI
jgi:competence protein ComEA